MTQGTYIIESNRKIANNIYEMQLFGDTTAIKAPGQFINILIDGLYLRRPISVCDVNDGIIKIIYKVVGKGTEKLSTFSHSKQLDVLTGLGNGFSLSDAKNPVVIGGGVGVPPMYMLCKELIKTGKPPIAILGFNTKNDVFYKEEFEKLGIKTLITTVDGSVGIKGFVTDALKTVKTYSYFYTCGPKMMLKAVYDATTTSGEFSFEERMGCGFGACMGCTCKTKYGNKRICKDGPVLKKEEIIW